MFLELADNHDDDNDSDSINEFGDNGIDFVQTFATTCSIHCYDAVFLSPAVAACLLKYHLAFSGNHRQQQQQQEQVTAIMDLHSCGSFGWDI